MPDDVRMSQLQDAWDAKPRRYYRREWGRNKAHLPKSVSLPICKLFPLNRPIFTCRRCGFINTLVPLCLWCRWTSDEAHREFEESTPRARRASAPPRFYWKPWVVPESPRRESNDVSTTIKRVPNSARLSGDIVTMQQQRPIGQVNDRSLPNSVSTPHHLTYHHQHEPRTSAAETTATRSLQVANATAPAATLVRDLSRQSWSNERIRKVGTAGSIPQKSSIHFPRLRHSVSAGVDRRNHKPMHLIKTFSTKSLRSTPIVIDLKTFDDVHDTKFKSTNNDSNNFRDSAPPTRKTLKRKKRVSLFRASASLPPRPPSSNSSNSSFEETPLKAPQSSFLPGPSRNTFLAYDNPNMLTHSRSKSQPPDNVARLGHPSRPYYTAIRPNMSPPRSSADLPRLSTTAQFASTSRPTRPMSLPTPSRAPSPGIFSVLSFTSVFTEEEGSPIMGSGFTFRPRSSSTNSYSHSHQRALGSSFHHHNRGFSLSGETELRMALAEHGSWNDRDQFKFKDTGKRHSGVGVFRKVRKLKEGLKGLVGK